MRFSEGAQRSVTIAPVVEFDASSPLAGVYLLALLTWPKDRRRQQHGLATYAAEMIAFCRSNAGGLASELFGMTVAAVADRLGVPKAEVLSMPQARPIAEAMAFDAHNLRPFIEEELLDPAGGFQALAEAPGSAVLRAEADAVLAGPVRNVGRTLQLIAALHHHHPDTPASLNRAFAIMEADAKVGRRPGVTARTLRAHWSDWRGIAPLAAALWVWNNTIEREEDARERIADAFATETGVRTILGWAMWFRQFGTQFSPSRGQASIIPEAEAVQYRTNATLLLPPLPPLFPEELQDARLYRAPTTKFG